LGKDDNNKTGQSMITISKDLLRQAYRYALSNTDEVYINNLI